MKLIVNIKLKPLEMQSEALLETLKEANKVRKAIDLSLGDRFFEMKHSPFAKGITGAQKLTAPAFGFSPEYVEETPQVMENLPGLVSDVLPLAAIPAAILAIAAMPPRRTNKAY